MTTSETRPAWGAGLATEAADGTVLDAWFRWLGWGEFGEEDQPDVDDLGMREFRDEVRNVTVRTMRVTVDVATKPSSALDVYLRLHLH